MSTTLRSRATRPGRLALVGLVLSVVWTGTAPAASARVHGPVGSDTTAMQGPPESLAGRVVVIDPGHQLGNARFPGRIRRLVSAGPFRKPCNTTGTSTAGGFPEATFTWRVALVLRERLRERGARVVMTRRVNSADRWGPCVDVRGRAGNRLGADLKVSIHGDGSTRRGAHGFHVIAPRRVAGWTDDIVRASLRLARAVRAGLLDQGLRRAGYVAGGDGLDLRSDLATLNLSDVPVVLAELGNMRSRADAARMTSRTGQQRYADGLLSGIVRYLRGR